jgi:hypothetical protein
MRLLIQVTRPDPAALRWRIAFANPELAAIPAVELAATVKEAYPLIEPRAPAAFDLNAVQQAARNVAAKSPLSGDTERFGRYLFQVLIGDDALARIRAQGPLEAIALDCEERDFSRIPWEMLWLDDNFAAYHGVGITRVLGTQPAAPKDVTISPVVLFVIGSEVNDPRIRAAAEYLALLKRLETKGLQIESHVIARATSKKIADAVERLKPAIVHFICHGGPAGSNYIELASDDPTRPFDKLDPEQLANLVQGIPSAIVLNACDTAGGISVASSDSATLALSIARKGPPVVIGMAGRVADLACRLFTRQFYEALVSGRSLEDATAAGRREGLLHGSKLSTTVDWAMPTLFVREGVRLRMDPQLLQIQKERAQRANAYRKTTDPLLICGRSEFLDAQQTLLEEGDTDAPKVLVLKVCDRAAKVSNPRYGMTRSLEELAARAAKHGHIPCLVRLSKAQGAIVDPPRTPLKLAQSILAQFEPTRERFGLRGAIKSQVMHLAPALKSGDTSRLSDSVRSKLDFHPAPGADEPHEEVIRAALREDLEALAADIRALPGTAPHARVLVLIDDLHACAEAATVLVGRWLQAQGLGRAARSEEDWKAGIGPIPVVLAYSAPTAISDKIYESTARELQRLTEQSPTLFQLHELKPFVSPEHDDLPYQQFLLSRVPMLVLDPSFSQDTHVECLKQLHFETYGVPSRFSKDVGNESVHAVVNTAKALKVLTAAQDDDLLKVITESRV